jgi:hypothetical protein
MHGNRSVGSVVVEQVHHSRRARAEGLSVGESGKDFLEYFLEDGTGREFVIVGRVSSTPVR